MPLPPVVEKAIARGWSVIPVRANKRPAIKSWSEFQKTPATAAQAAKWAQFASVKGWAVVAGAVSKLVILDFDGEQGRKTCQSLGLIPHVRTPSGGYHVYFEHPGWKVPTLNAKSSKALGAKWPALDIRADGGYAVFWGELAGGSYRWSRKAELEPLSRLPRELRQFLHLERSAPAPRAAGQAADPPPTLDLAGRLLDSALSRARQDGRNNAGFWYACQLRDNGVPEQLARGLMERYAASCPSTNTKGKPEPYTAEEALASLREAYAAPARDPIPQKRPRPARQPQPEPPARPRIDRPEDDWPGYTGQRYAADEKHGLFYFRETRDAHIRNRLTNFTAVITADVLKDDGERTSGALKIEGKLKGKPFAVVVSRSEFETMSWPIEQLGAEAIVYPNFKDHARTAIQELSPNKSVQHIYQHTGWTRVEGQPYFLHAGGAIGAEGLITSLAVELPRQLSRYRLPRPPKGGELVRSIRASLKILDVCPERLTLPLFSAIWRPVLGEVDVALYLSGQSGNGKSELAALAQQHYGPEMSRRHLPANWESSANALQGITYYAKNALVTVDDFVPKGSAGDIARQHKEADRLIRAAGNLQG